MNSTPDYSKWHCPPAPACSSFFIDHSIYNQVFKLMCLLPVCVYVVHYESWYKASMHFESDARTFCQKPVWDSPQRSLSSLSSGGELQNFPHHYLHNCDFSLYMRSRGNVLIAVCIWLDCMHECVIVCLRVPYSVLAGIMCVCYLL